MIAELRYVTDGGTEVFVDLGTVQSVDEHTNATVTSVPIVTMDSANTFCMDTGSVKTVSVSCTHVDNGPEGGGEGAAWKRKLAGFVDRWQAKTDGCVLTFAPEVQGEPFYRPMSYNGYIKALSFSYHAGSPDTITSNLTFNVGRMIATGDTFHEGPVIYDRAFYATLRAGDQNGVFMLMNEDRSFIESYEMTYGPTQPFGLLTLKLNLKQLKEAYDREWTGSEVVDGKTIVYVNAVGRGSFLVREHRYNRAVRSRATTVTLTAYGIDQMYAGIGLTGELKSNVTMENKGPFEAIRVILENSLAYSVNGVALHHRGTFEYAFRTEYNEWWHSEKDDGSVDDAGGVVFKSGTSLWYVLQACAAMLGCQLFFMDGYAYLVDPTLSEEELSGGNVTKSDHFDEHSGHLRHVNVGKKSRKTTGTPLGRRVKGGIELGDVGSNAVMNSMVVNGVRTGDVLTWEVEEATVEYDPGLPAALARSRDPDTGYNTSKNELTVTISEMNEKDSLAMADRYPAISCNATASIEFEMNEDMRIDGARAWCATFKPFTYVDFFESTEDGVDLPEEGDAGYTSLGECTAQAVWNPKEIVPQTLRLSKAVHMYPSKSTEYTFGMLSQSDLSQALASTSKTLNT